MVQLLHIQHFYAGHIKRKGGLYKAEGILKRNICVDGVENGGEDIVYSCHRREADELFEESCHKYLLRIKTGNVCLNVARAETHEAFCRFAVEVAVAFFDVNVQILCRVVIVHVFLNVNVNAADGIHYANERIG